VPTGSPAGANNTHDQALGFAFSEFQALGEWGGSPGQFTADQAAVAGKLLYDSVLWGSPVPAMDPGVLTAYNAIDGWFEQAIGATGPARITVQLVGGGTQFSGSSSVSVSVNFPGVPQGLAGIGLDLSITNGTFSSATGPTSISGTTGGGGTLVVPIFNSDGGSVVVTGSSTSLVGQGGLDFYRPTERELTAQVLAAFGAPAPLAADPDQFQATAEGTLSVVKAGDDTSYFGLGGAQFEVLSSNQTVVATLTTNAQGNTPTTTELPAGTYTVKEIQAPDGYQLAPNQSGSVVPGTNTVVAFTDGLEERISPAALAIVKSAVSTGVLLAGAVFDIRYDSANNGVYNDDLGDCTTGSGGECAPPGNDGSGFLPGDYQITEISAPSGYDLSPTNPVQDVVLAPGHVATVNFSDDPTAGLYIDKSGDDTAYASVVGAVFSLEGPAPSTANVGTFTVGTNGESNDITGLVAGTYTLTETTAPAGYQTIAPIQVTVALGVNSAVDVVDHIKPATLTLTKSDAATGAVLAGAIFDVRYDSANNGVYDKDLGDCTTNSSGECTPTGNDGSGFLPGKYQITEVSAPPGYTLNSANAVQDIVLTPGQVGTVQFSDQAVTTPALTANSITGSSTTGSSTAGGLAFTGGPSPLVYMLGAALVIVGSTLWIAGSRRRRSPAHARRH
jgi:hypothetical protein